MLIDAAEDISKIVARYGARRPDALALATRAAFATRLEPSLLRRLRLEVDPALDVGAETDLWAGPLVRSRFASVLILDEAVSQHLRESLLRTDAALARRCASVIAATHGDLDDTLRAEEELLYLTAAVSAARLDGQDAATFLAKIDNRLAWALDALLRDGPDRMVARWAYRAVPPLPGLDGHPLARMLIFAAAARLELALPGEFTIRDDEDQELLRDLLPASVRRVDVGVRRAGRQLVLSLPPETEAPFTIGLPAIDPLAVSIFTPSGLVQTLRMRHGQPVVVDAHRGELELRTILGETARVPVEHNSGEMGVTLVVPPRHLRLAERMAAMLEEAADALRIGLTTLIRTSDEYTPSRPGRRLSHESIIIGLIKPGELTVPYCLAQARFLGWTCAVVRMESDQRFTPKGSLLTDLPSVAVADVENPGSLAMALFLESLVSGVRSEPPSGLMADTLMRVHTATLFDGWRRDFEFDLLRVDPARPDMVQLRIADSLFLRLNLPGARFDDALEWLPISGEPDMKDSALYRDPTVRANTAALVEQIQQHRSHRLPTSTSEFRGMGGRRRMAAILDDGASIAVIWREV